jgi:hypothetical protein
MDLFDEAGAAFSEDRRHRYELWRIWDRKVRKMVVIGLNPSTADETKNDPTIRRCINFAQRERCGGLVMLNLFGFRATDPKVMKLEEDPIGPGNDAAIKRWVMDPNAVVVAAWGTHGAHRDRDLAVCSYIHALDVEILCFGTTAGGFPLHPLYLPNDKRLVRYRGGAQGVR